jgi:hypothetical protein
MRYIKVVWNHSLPTEPVLLYSELDDNRWELRKVEQFRDGTLGYADSDVKSDRTRLSIEPLPSLSQIALQSQFIPLEISREEFEAIWRQAVNV